MLKGSFAAFEAWNCEQYVEKGWGGHLIGRTALGEGECECLRYHWAGAFGVCGYAIELSCFGKHREANSPPPSVVVHFFSSSCLLAGL